MKWKVCGMRDRENIEQALQLEPDFMGFIFYEKSPRFIGNDPEIQNSIDFGKTKKVGVFVNHDYEHIVENIKEYSLDFVQLHGDETVSLVEKLKNAGSGVIKVFRVQDHLPLNAMKEFESTVDFILLDTKTERYGGSGKSFDWNILSDYSLNVPLIISGGIDLESIDQLKEAGHSFIDVNSKFEMAPGFKSIKKLKALKDRL